jgi:spore maturation protein CgeB
MCEVMGMGALLLTRDAPNLHDRFPAGCLASFADERDCVGKIRHYLANEREREEMAARGQRFILENMTYDILMGEVDVRLREALARRRG